MPLSSLCFYLRFLKFTLSFITFSVIGYFAVTLFDVVTVVVTDRRILCLRCLNLLFSCRCHRVYKGLVPDIFMDIADHRLHIDIKRVTSVKDSNSNTSILPTKYLDFLSKTLYKLRAIKYNLIYSTCATAIVTCLCQNTRQPQCQTSLLFAVPCTSTFLTARLNRL